MSFIPTVISTTFNHYTRGPPQPSWGLKFHLSFKIFKSMVNDSANKTIEQVQESTNLPIPIPDGVTTRESKIDNKYRLESQVHLDKILKPYEHVLDPEWKDLKDDGIVSEWVQVPDDGWETRKIRKTILFIHGGVYILGGKKFARCITSKLAKGTKARVFCK